MDEKLERLVKYIKDNSEGESIFLTPCPSYSVESTGLLDEIADIFDVDKEEIEGLINGKKEVF